MYGVLSVVVDSSNTQTYVCHCPRFYMQPKSDYCAGMGKVQWDEFDCPEFHDYFLFAQIVGKDYGNDLLRGWLQFSC